MKARSSLFRLSGALCAVLALAASTYGAAGDEPQNAPAHQTPAPAPAAVAPDPGALLATLLGQLRNAPTADAAKPVEEAIWSLWLKSGSDTSDLLMSWAVEAMGEKNYDRAIQYLDAIIEQRPDFAEAWNKRATVYYLRDEYGKSLNDLRVALALQPQHFGALAGLGVILQEIDEKPRALDAFRKALVIHPHFESAKKAAEKLEIEVEGREI